MLLISLKNIKKSFGDIDVLKDVNLDIKDNDRIGLVGRNGAGKSTIVEIIGKSLKPDRGEIKYYSSTMSMEYVRQSIYQQTSNNITEEIKEILNDDSGKKSSLLKTTGKFGYGDSIVIKDLVIDCLSGGERMKVILSKVFAQNPKLLLLDEPTNHLDLEGINYLISALRGYKGALLVISHDRYFLDETVDCILELEEGIIKKYIGNYSFYREEKKKEYESLIHQYQNEIKKKEKIRKEINRL